MKLTDVIILSIVQGISEWLPISSSGHLVLFRHLISIKEDISFDIFLHFSALFVILVFFWKDIQKIFKGLKNNRKSQESRLLLYIILATIPTGILGLFLRKYMDSLATVKTISFTFLITSLLLFASTIRSKNRRITIGKALFIGVMQGFALLPGISRSGATISAGKMAGLSNEESFRFSFLLAVPAITGAIVLEAKKITSLPISFLIIGFFTSFLLGLLSLFFLRKILVKDKFYLFGVYTLFLSIILFLL